MTYADQDAAMLARYQLRPSGAPHCPRVVVGKRCHVGRRWPTHHGHARCLCERHRVLFDHGRTWIDPTGQHVVTGEPYDYGDGDANAGRVAELVADAAREGVFVTVEISSDSPWYPGRTTLVIVRSAKLSELT